MLGNSKSDGGDGRSPFELGRKAAVTFRTQGGSNMNVGGKKKVSYWVSGEAEASSIARNKCDNSAAVMSVGKKQGGKEKIQLSTISQKGLFLIPIPAQHLVLRCVQKIQSLECKPSSRLVNGNLDELLCWTTSPSRKVLERMISALPSRSRAPGRAASLF